MNVVLATSPASAPSAGVIPGPAAGAQPGAGPSFADVLQQLAGGDAPAAVAGDGSARAPDGGATTGPTGDAAEAGGDAAGAYTDLTAAMGAMTVPVAFVLPVVTEVSPAAVAGEVAVATDEATSITRASSGPAPAWGAGSDAAAGGVPGVTPARVAGTAGGRRPEFAVAGSVAADVVGRTGAAATAPSAPAPSAPAAAVPAATSPTLSSAPMDPSAGLDGPPATSVERLVGASAATGRASDSTGRSLGDPTSALGADRRTWSEAARSSVDLTHLDTPMQPAPATAKTVGPVSTGDPVVAETPAAAAPQAAALIARLMADPAHDFGRARGLPQAVARALDGGPIAAAAGPPTDTAVATVAGAAALPTGLDGLAADVIAQVAPAAFAGAASARAPHPGLSAALRAFQQAGAPAAAGGASEGPVESVTASSNQPGPAARFAALTGGEGEAAASSAEVGRRAFSLPALATAIVPSLGGDLRVGSGLSAGARLEAASLATLTPADGDDVRAQIVQSIRVQWTGGAGEARVRLRPEHLGEVVATIKVDQGAVTATLQAERPEVRRWMEAHTQTLREGLVEHGLKLDRLVVLAEPARGDARDDTQGRARGRQPQHPQQRPRRPRPDDSGATFDLNP